MAESRSNIAERVHRRSHNLRSKAPRTEFGQLKKTLEARRLVSVDKVLRKKEEEPIL